MAASASSEPRGLSGSHRQQSSYGRQIICATNSPISQRLEEVARVRTSPVGFSPTSASSSLFWVVLTVVGIASVNSATKALDQKFSVPGKEGWETNVAIAEHFHGTGGDTRPDRAGGHAARRARRSTRPASTSQLDAGGPASSSRRCPARGSPPTPRRATATFVSKDGRTTFAIVYPQPDPNSAFGENPDAAKAARAALEGVDGRRRARSRERLRCAAERVRAATAARACSSSPCSAASAP